MKLEALHLSGRRYAVRPQGAIGTCGWIAGQPWQVTYVEANNEKHACRRVNAGQESVEWQHPDGHLLTNIHNLPRSTNGTTD